MANDIGTVISDHAYTWLVSLGSQEGIIEGWWSCWGNKVDDFGGECEATCSNTLKILVRENIWIILLFIVFALYCLFISYKLCISYNLYKCYIDWFTVWKSHRHGGNFLDNRTNLSMPYLQKFSLLYHMLYGFYSFILIWLLIFLDVKA